MLKLRLLIVVWLFSCYVPDVKAQDYKRIIAESTDYVEITEAYSELMRSFGPQRIDSVTFYAEEAIRFFQDKGYAVGECVINLNMAQVMMFNGGLAEAENYGKEAIRIAEKEDLPVYLARGYDFMTVIYGKGGAFVKSTEYAYHALRANEKLGDQRGVIASYVKLCAISLDMQKPEESLSFAHIADSINKATIRNVHLETGIISNKGIAYMQLEQLDDALEMFQQVYEIAESDSTMDRRLIPSALLNIGKVYIKRNNHLQAISYFNRSLDKSIEYNLPDSELQSRYNIALVFTDLKNFGESNNHAFMALEKSRMLNFSDIEVNLLELISNNFKELKDWPNALGYSKVYYDQLIVLKDERNEMEIKELQSAYRLEKAEENLKIAQAMSASRAKQRDISIGFSIAILCFMFGLVYAYRKIGQLNAQNEKTKNQLAESNQVKDKLFSIIGHDLRGTFSGTLGFLNMMKENQISEEKKPVMIDKVIHESKSALGILDNLLMWGFTQIRSGKQLHLTHFNGFDAVTQNMVFHSGAIEHKQLTVRNLIPEKLSLHADENHFLFITRNLISNAIKFTPNGGEIRVGYKDHSTQFHEFYVMDNGAGMSEEQLGNLFTPMAQSTYGTGQEKGAGLGLLLCKEFVNLHGGQIWVESKQGEGTIFYFTLPKSFN